MAPSVSFPAQLCAYQPFRGSQSLPSSAANITPPLVPTSGPLQASSPHVFTWWLLPVLQAFAPVLPPRGSLVYPVCHPSLQHRILIFFIELNSTWSYLFVQLPHSLWPPSPVHTAQERGPGLSPSTLPPAPRTWNIAGAQNVLIKHMNKKHSIGSSFSSVRLDAARFINHRIKPIRPLKTF